MSAISLGQAKQLLDVIHDLDDAKLQLLLDGVEDEAALYMNRTSLGESWPDGVPASVVLGVVLLLQAAYGASPDDVPKLRRAAEVKLHPHRLCLGV